MAPAAAQTLVESKEEQAIGRLLRQKYRDTTAAVHQVGWAVPCAELWHAFPLPAVVWEAHEVISGLRNGACRLLSTRAWANHVASSRGSPGPPGS